MSQSSNNKQLSAAESKTILNTLESRFNKYIQRHKGIKWADVAARLETNPIKLWVLHEMESTGGEPDVVGQVQNSGEYLFFDCAAESPKGRRSVCFDYEGQVSRKEHQSATNAVDMAAAIGIEILTEDQYRTLQLLGEFDLKTSSWVATPDDIRELGGALFCDRRYNAVFLYHNGAQSYYAARGFRGSLKV